MLQIASSRILKVPNPMVVLMKTLNNVPEVQVGFQARVKAEVQAGDKTNFD